jgi:very-short-patch-repair endonuclease
MGKHLDKLLETKFDVELIQKSSNNHNRRKYINQIIHADLLKELFIEEKMSANAICNEILAPLGLKMTAGSLIERAQNLNISTPSAKESARNLSVRDKYKKTCIAKYGTENALSKSSTAYDKRNQTIKTKYGVSNVFQLEEVKQKSISTMIKKYGVAHTVELDSYERNNGRRSKIHIKVENILNELSIPFRSEVKAKFKAVNSFLKREYSPQVDILIESCNLVIEVYGDLWHANPNTYKESDLIYKWQGRTKVKDIWDFDSSRTKQIESFGYEVICMWESDINKKPETIREQLYDKCKDFINQKS